MESGEEVQGAVGGPSPEPAGEAVAVLMPPRSGNFHQTFVPHFHSEPYGPLYGTAVGFRRASSRWDPSGRVFYDLQVPIPTGVHEADRPGPRARLADYDRPPCLNMKEMSIGLCLPPHRPPPQSPPSKSILLISLSELAQCHMGHDYAYFRRLTLDRHGVHDTEWDLRWVFGGYMHDGDTLCMHLDFTNGHLIFGPQEQIVTADLIRACVSVMNFPPDYPWTIVQMVGGRRDVQWLARATAADWAQLGPDVGDGLMDDAIWAVADWVDQMQADLCEVLHPGVKFVFCGSVLCRMRGAAVLSRRSRVLVNNPGLEINLYETLFGQLLFNRNFRQSRTPRRDAEPGTLGDGANPAVGLVIPLCFDQEVCKAFTHELLIPMVEDLIRAVYNCANQAMGMLPANLTNLHIANCAGEPERELQVRVNPGDYTVTRARGPLEPHTHWGLACEHPTFVIYPDANGTGMFHHRLERNSGDHLVSLLLFLSYHVLLVQREAF